MEGAERSVNAFIRFCKKNPIGLSQRVQLKDVEMAEATGEFQDFQVFDLDGNKMLEDA